MKAQSSSDPIGFSLMEILVVMAIMAVLMGLLLPAITRRNADLTAAAYKIEGLLAEARTYAVAHNTFVWVGFTELNGAVNFSPSALNSGTGAGRVVVTTIASRNGMRGYDITTSQLPSPACWASYSGSNYFTIGKLQYFSGLHLYDLGTPPTNGNMARPSVSANYNLGNGACTSVTPYAWPLGTPASGYNFFKVINFDPQGVARIQYSNGKDTIVPYIEIGLVPATANVPQTSSKNTAAIQIDCMTGATRIYRP